MPQSVEDICRAADIGRSTFYTHYPDKDALREAAIDEHMLMLQDLSADRQVRSVVKGFAFSRPVFEHAQAKRDMHRGLIGGIDRIMPDEIREWITTEVRRDLIGLRGDRTDGMAFEVATRYVVGAFLEVLNWWLEADSGPPPEAVDQMFQRLAFEGVRAI